METGTKQPMYMFCKLYVLVSCLSTSMSVQITSIDSNESAASNASLHRVKQMGHVLDTLLADYDKRVRPDVGGAPVHVSVNMHILAIVPISEVNMVVFFRPELRASTQRIISQASLACKDFTATFFFRQYWRDHRLAFGNVLPASSIKPSAPFADQIWRPDTIFELDMSDHKTRHDFLLEITSDGNVTYSARKRVQSYCLMDLRKFPMDEQNCELSFQSYGYNDKDIVYTWRMNGNTHVTLSERLAIPQYTLAEWKVFSRNDTYVTGNFPALGVSFKFQRHLGFYIIQDFIPTGLIVMLSWVSFWINENSVPARVSLGITTVLAITTLITGVQASLPKVSYVKAIDFYLLGSFLFVFGALIEFAIICTVTDSKERNSHDTSAGDDVSTRDSSTVPSSGFSNSSYVSEEPEDSLKNTSHFSWWFSFCDKKKVGPEKKTSIDANSKRSLPHPVDRASRILFPVAFYSFVLIYCVTFLIL